MSDNPTDDLLVVMLDLENAGITEKVKGTALKGAALKAMFKLGWTTQDATDTWDEAVRSAAIRYNAWSQPALSTSGRAAAIAIRENRTNGLTAAKRPKDATKTNPPTPKQSYVAVSEFHPYMRPPDS